MSVAAAGVRQSNKRKRNRKRRGKLTVAEKPCPKIRVTEAVLEDLPIVEDMTRQMFETMDVVKGYGGVNKENVYSVGEMIIKSPQHIILAARTSDGRIVGMLMLMEASGFVFAQKKVAHEVAWWVYPNARKMGVGVALLKAGEQWARSNGMVAIIMNAFRESQDVARLYLKNGFRLAESLYSKEF